MSRDSKEGFGKYCAKFVKGFAKYIEDVGELDRVEKLVKGRLFKSMERGDSSLATVVDHVYSGDKGGLARYHIKNWVDKELSPVLGTSKANGSYIIGYLYNYVDDLSSHRGRILDRAGKFKEGLKPNLESFGFGYWNDDRINKRFVDLHRKHFFGYKMGMMSGVRNYAMLEGENKLREGERFEREDLEIKINDLGYLCERFGESLEDGVRKDMLGLFDRNVEWKNSMREKDYLIRSIRENISDGFSDSGFFQPEYNMLLDVHEKLGQYVGDLKKEFREDYARRQEVSVNKFARDSIRCVASDLADYKARSVVEAFEPKMLADIDKKREERLRLLPSDAESLFF